MNLLKIYNSEDTEQNFTFPEGEHYFGNHFLNVTNSLSPRSVLFNVGPYGATITSENKCFYKALNDDNFRLLSINDRVALNNDDQFTLLANTYKVKIIKETENETPEAMEVTERIVGAIPENIRIQNQIYGENSCKRRKLDHNVIATNPSLSYNSDHLQHVTENIAVYPNISSQLISNENYDLNGYINSTDPVKQDKTEEIDKTKQEKIDFGVTNETNTSAHQKKKVRRVRCYYGPSFLSCRSDDTEHRAKYSHPGDGDYSSDSDDDRPHCEFGNRCYRRNPEHRRQFKHYAKPATKPSGTKSPIKPEKTHSNYKDDEESEDDETGYDTAEDPDRPDSIIAEVDNHSSDSEDKRPKCKYDKKCYRKNVFHVAGYKHTGVPAPKPSAARTPTKRVPMRAKSDNENDSVKKCNETASDADDTDIQGDEENAGQKKKKSPITPEVDSDSMDGDDNGKIIITVIEKVPPKKKK